MLHRRGEAKLHHTENIFIRQSSKGCEWSDNGRNKTTNLIVKCDIKSAIVDAGFDRLVANSNRL